MALMACVEESRSPEQMNFAKHTCGWSGGINETLLSRVEAPQKFKKNIANRVLEQQA